MTRVRVAIAAAAVAATAGCAPEPAGDQGAAVKDLYDVFFYVAAGVFVVVAGLIAWSIVRFRKRPGDDGAPPQIAHNLALEITWFALPTAIVIVLFVLSAGALQDVNDEDPSPTVTVRVDAFQWGWRFVYEGEAVAVEGLPEAPARIVLPVDEPLRFDLRSRDVVHSFYVPRFLIKRDTVPGETNRIDYVIRQEGTYDGKCAEFCGVLHDRMPFTIEAVPMEEFEEWLADQRTENEDAGI
ncbi:MAG TPA: cytochrome c oxidase subunit II [Actinomycetota bacterium]|nr:cytochrome c oxidase subunit II [Actinomycetota bacterium]